MKKGKKATEKRDYILVTRERQLLWMQFEAISNIAEAFDGGLETQCSLLCRSMHLSLIAIRNGFDELLREKLDEIGAAIRSSGKELDQYDTTKFAVTGTLPPTRRWKA